MFVGAVPRLAIEKITHIDDVEARGADGVTPAECPLSRRLGPLYPQHRTNQRMAISVANDPNRTFAMIMPVAV